MNRPPRLAPNRAHQARMGMPERIYSDTAKKIQILAPSRVVYSATASSREHDRRPLISIHQVARFVRTRTRRRQPALRRYFIFSHFYRAVPCAAFAAEAFNTGRTRVPEQRTAFAAFKSARGAVPPTIRTSATPADSAR